LTPRPPARRGSCGTPIRVLACDPEDQGLDVPPCRRPGGPPRMDLVAQRRRTMSRCQRRIVSGGTSSRSPWRRAFGITPARTASSGRSARDSFGRPADWRCRTTSWWRRIKISAIFHASSHRDSRSHATARVISRNTNHRHTKGDHHGPTAGEQLCWSEPWMRFSARQCHAPVKPRRLVLGVRRAALGTMATNGS
jgi:hypothetical protein